MNHLMDRLVRKNARRSKQLVAPVMLVLGLLGFAVSQIPNANTLWSETLTVDSNVGIATYTPTNTPVPPTATPTTTTGGACEGFITFTGKTTAGDITTYNYTFSRNAKDPSGPNCHDMSFIAFKVCFNPEISLSAGRIHTTTQPSGWTYSPDNGGSDKRVKWDATGTVNAPVAGLAFSISIEGPLGPDAQAPYQIHAGGGAPAYEGGGKTVTVPHPTSCGSTTPFTSLGINPSACLPLELKNDGLTSRDGRSEFELRLSGGSAAGRDGCPVIDQVIVPVCFNPALSAGWLLDAENAGRWQYTGQMEDTKATPAVPRALIWTRNGGNGPWNVEFSYVAPGENLPVVKVHAIGRAANGTDYDLGEVEVPRPASCDALPPAPTPTNVVAQPTTAPAPAQNTPVPTATPEPTRIPRPGTTPDTSSRATPTPELIGGVVWE